jgi:hypothetical protein
MGWTTLTRWTAPVGRVAVTAETKGIEFVFAGSRYNAERAKCLVDRKVVRRRVGNLRPIVRLRVQRADQNASIHPDDRGLRAPAAEEVGLDVCDRAPRRCLLQGGRASARSNSRTCPRVRRPSARRSRQAPVLGAVRRPAHPEAPHGGLTVARSRPIGRNPPCQYERSIIFGITARITRSTHGVNEGAPGRLPLGNTAQSAGRLPHSGDGVSPAASRMHACRWASMPGVA